MSSTLYRGGAVHAPTVPDATSLLVVDGVVTWLGTDDEADGLASAADEVVELRGALVTPGFVDAHVHVLESGLHRDGVDLSGAATLADALALVGSVAHGPDARRLAAEGAPLAGYGWDDGSWPERRTPTRDELDAVGGGAPVYLARLDRDAAVVSTSFAEVLGLRRLAGWREDGLVTGTAHEVARDALLDVAPARRDRLYREVLEVAARSGVVSVHEQSAPRSDTRAGLARLLELTVDPAGGLPLVVGYRAELCETTDDARAVRAAVPGLTGVGGDLRMDGSIGARTAALRSRYTDAPTGAEHPAGRLDLSAEQVSNHVAAVTRAGLQAGFHVIGDRAMDEVLLGFRAAADVEGIDGLRRAGHRLEHATMLDAPALATAVLLGLTCSVQPAFDAAWGGPDGRYAARLGRGRAASLTPVADLVAAGVPVALGSGSPVTSLDPWTGVRAAVRHRTPDQRVSVRAAMAAATRGGWLAAGRGGDGAGELRVGAPAHLAVWEVDRDAAAAVMADAAGGAAEARPAWHAYGTDRPDPVLPALAEGEAAPRCVRTVRDGVVLHDTLG
ncbi:MAG TPA: amidohydrolase family protein [Cellulomonas sp.]